MNDGWARTGTYIYADFSPILKIWQYANDIVILLV